MSCRLRLHRYRLLQQFNNRRGIASRGFFLVKGALEHLIFGKRQRYPFPVRRVVAKFDFRQQLPNLFVRQFAIDQPLQSQFVQMRVFAIVWHQWLRDYLAIEFAIGSIQPK